MTVDELISDGKIPDGKTCGECRNFGKCSWMICAKADSDHCDWWPSKFAIARDDK